MLAYLYAKRTAYNNVKLLTVMRCKSYISLALVRVTFNKQRLTDFIFTIDKISQMFITGPKVVKQVMFMDISEEDLGGAAIHAQKSGVAHWKCDDEKSCYENVRKLLDYIPHFYGDTEPFEPKSAAKRGIFGTKVVPNFKFDGKKLETINSILPEESKKGYDMRAVVNSVVDDDSFFEVMKEFAANALTGFAKVEGKTVGVIANNPMGFGGVLNCDASDKIARFVRYCDAFNVPLLNFVDVPGFIPGPQEEQKGIIRHGAKVLYAYSEASVPKVTIITRKACVHRNVFKTSWSRFCLRMAKSRNCSNGCRRSNRCPLCKRNEGSF